MGTPSNLSLGPGRLFVAPVGTAEPTALLASTAKPPAPWAEVGYTAEGSTFSYEFSSEDVPVAESFDPIITKTTGRTGSISFSMAENTVRNLTLAFNGGTVASLAGGVLAYEPPEPGTEVRKMLLFLAEDGTELWVFRKVFQSGSVGMDRKKGADKTLIPVEFKLEKPDGLTPFRALYAGSRSGDASAVVTPPVVVVPPTDPTPTNNLVTSAVSDTV